MRFKNFIQDILIIHKKTFLNYQVFKIEINHIRKQLDFTNVTKKICFEVQPNYHVLTMLNKILKN